MGQFAQCGYLGLPSKARADRLGERTEGLPLTVDQKSSGWGLPETGKPPQQLIPVRMGREAVYLLDAGPHRHHLPVHLQLLRAVQQAATSGPRCLLDGAKELKMH